MRQISLKTAEAIADAWPNATSLKDAMRLAGVKNKDARALNRYRREAEALTDTELPTINDKNHTNTQHCPTNLDLKKAKRHKYFIVTSVTNDAPIADNFLASIRHLEKEYDAQILCIPCNYKNSNALHKTDGYTWPNELRDYYLNDDLILSKKLLVKRSRISPTTVSPLAGRQNVGGQRSCVYGHPQLSILPVGTPASEIPKYIMTTGTLSRPRYGDSPTGDKARLNHIIGAKFIRVRGDDVFPWDIEWDGKGFYHLDKYYTPKGVTSGHRCAAFDEGDSHVAHVDKQVRNARFDSKGALCKLIKPKLIIRDDIHDHQSQSYHSDVFDQIGLAAKNLDIVEDELNKSVDYLNETLPDDCINVITPSNHHDHLRKWLNRFDARKDPRNAPFAFQMQADLAQSIMSGGSDDPFELFVKPKLHKKALWADRTKPFLIAGNVDAGSHGDKGINGAKGSMPSFAKSNYKMNVGHNHMANRVMGAMSKGKSTQKLHGYESGLSTHDVADIITYLNGKRTHAFFRRDFGI